MHALLIGNTDKHLDDISAALFDPFFYERKTLAREIPLTFEHRQAFTLDDIEAAVPHSLPDVLFLRPDWREDPNRVVDFVASLRQRHPQLRLLFLDPWDQTTSRYFGVLPHVDILWKCQRLKDRTDYLKTYAGGHPITDYFANTLNFELNDWDVSSVVEPGYENRIEAGWNFAISKKYRRQLLSPVNQYHNSYTKRPIDVFCHLSLGNLDDKHSWYAQHRKHCLATLEPLQPKRRLAISGDYFGQRTVSSRQYQQDIRNSKIVVSPFGWGEATWRDYEAACHHCLLIKPSIEHIYTQPDIFSAGETYVPVRWDLADLVDTCEYYLQHPDEAQQIAENAHNAYRRYFAEKQFVKTIRDAVTG